MIRPVLCVLSVFALTGCAVVDLAAHGVKTYEKSKEAPAPQQDDVAVSQPAPVYPQEQPMRDVGYEPQTTSVPTSTGGAIKAQPLE